MDQREWGLLRETVVRRTQASGASREDAEDATHDALLAAIGQPQHPRSEVAWLSTVAQRRRVDLIRRRVREQRVPVAVSGGPDPTAAGPEDVVVDRAHASWLAASLTQLPPTTREVVDAVGAGMAPSEVARSMNLSARSVESHLTRARRHLRRMGALAVPVGVLLGWALRSRPGSRVAPAAMAVAIPMVVTAVALLPASTPMDGHPGGAPATALPGPAEAGPTPRGGLEAGSFAIEAIRPGPRSDGEQPALTGEQSGAAAPDLGVGQADDGAGPSRSDPTSPLPPPEGRTVPEQCGLELPVLDNLVCVLTDLAGGLTGGVVDGAAESPPEGTGRCPGGWGSPAAGAVAEAPAPWQDAPMIAGLLLAAGAGRRYGMPKALVEDGGWMRRAVAALTDGGCDPVLVVLGAAADRAAPLVPATATTVLAPDWAEGMGASLRAGLSALAASAGPQVQAAVVHLVDLPDVDASVVGRLAALAGPAVVARAGFDGQHGHPVLLGRRHWAAVVASAAGDRGARDWLAGRPDLTVVECSDLASGIDVDRPRQ